MTTISASDVKNRIGDLWDSADVEPVVVVRNGQPRYLVAAIDKYVAITRDEYDRLRGAKQAPRLGFAKDLFADADIDAILNVDLGASMEEHV